ncbi:HlyC/CorC family transporter [Paenibacillus montaniterrae]|uniref:HlyC/CorC family transporter n=1 Tax=Paenibacillus montaniterrae TaxID=429341 RepID=A0A919YKC8_9BACL|nr:hemolysin family protein [Paenibacillus montaniterrae]GIP15493.1 HlyC/CorC family transporter [Paenibacillus montaniterrae]
MDYILIINLFILVVLILLTAFFVASEFAVVKLRMSRIDQLIDEGNKKAVIAKKVASDLDYYLSACQLGITVTALGLGAIGKPAVERVMYPVFDLLKMSDTSSSIASYAIAFILVTFLHVVIGEMAPKTLAIQFSEKVTLMLSGPLYWFGKVMKPLIWSLNGTSRLLLQWFGVSSKAHKDIYSEDELRIIMTQSHQGGELDESKLTYMENVFTFDERMAKDVMTPRKSIVCLDKNMNYDEIISILQENNYTRYPVTIDNNKDQIIGIVNVKKMLPHIIAKRERKVEQFVTEMPTVLEITPIKQAMLKMQQERVHMALVIDEYGGTAGIITMEDILEEIVGEIRDEFDTDEVAEIQKVKENEYHINARVLLDDIERELNLVFEDKADMDTLGGWFQHHKGTLVEQGDQLSVGKYVWTIAETEHYQIKRIILVIHENEQ